MRFPEEFVRYHSGLLGGEYGRFMRYFMEPQERFSLRVNTLKASVREVKRVLAENGIEYGPVAWCPEGLWVSTNQLDTMEHQLGLYYIMSASSMIAPQVLGAGERVLDMCAAPGGKTTHLAQLMANKGTLIANEDNISRVRALVYNIQRCGLTNAAVTRLDAVKLGGYGERFDRVLLDAPCSSVGTLRHSREVLEKWGMGWVRSLALIQKRMILSGYDCLSDGGKLVYSTCTTTIEENEEVVEHLLSERPGAKLNKVKLDGLKVKRGLTEKAADCARVWPQDNDTEPHFIAEVVKDG